MMNKKITLQLNSVYVDKKVRRIPHNNSNMRFHWTQKNRWKKAWQLEVETQIMINRIKFGKLPLIRPEIIFKLYMCNLYDIDNAYGSIKPLLDSFKMWKGKNLPGMGVIVDDDDKNVEITVGRIKVNKRIDEKVIIDIIF